MSYLRPDEISSQSNIRRSNERDKLPKKIGKTAVGLGAAAIGGGALAGLSSRVLPFLNEYIPTELAIKGINKIAPKLGAFLQQGMQSGLNVKDGLKYIKDNLINEKLPEMASSDEEAGFEQPPQKKQSLVQGLQEDLDKQYGQQKQPNQKNIIQQYSPELFQFIQDQINSGRPVLEAGALAQQSKKYRHLIKKIEEDHKTPFSSILQVSFGEGLYPSGNKNQSQQGQQQPGKYQQGLMQSMDKLAQVLGKGR